MRKWISFLIIFIIPILSFSQKKVKTPKSFKLAPELEEASGLYIESADKLWWLNDSGDLPKLYQTNERGKLTKTIHLDKISNRDWEDLTFDDAGNIYIGDFGNNKNARKDLKVYIYHPENETLDSIQFSYPDQSQFPPPKNERNFDMEGFFWLNGQLHLFSKNRGNFYTKHYILEAKEGEQIAVLNDKINLKDRIVTAAAISPDKKTVALIAYIYKKRKPIPYSKASIFYFTDFEGTDFLKGKMTKVKVPSFIASTQYESIDFLDNKTVIVASEKTKFIRQKAKKLKVRF